ncbi:MAG: hypothetical protein DYH13_11015 [Alphaproteobacteria bacterium PRO2]|nr:hypothetical protein [Alphaproteobacteria bacterium PRO2]
MSIIDKLVDKAVDTAAGFIGKAVDSIPGLVEAGADAAFGAAEGFVNEHADKLTDKALDKAGDYANSALAFVAGSPAAATTAPATPAAQASSATTLNGNVKPHSAQLADGTIVLEPGNTAAALPAEAALRQGHRMPGEKPLTAKWWEDINKDGPTNLLSQYNVIDSSGHFNIKGLGDLVKAVLNHIMPRGEHGARMASNGSFKDLKFEDGSPAVIPKGIEPLDPKTGKTPEPELAINPLDPRLQPMAMNMSNTMGMKPV